MHDLVLAEDETVNRLLVLSGCSGGGKSALLAELARRGYRTVEEPGRRIVAEERLRSGAALPWVDLTAFAQRAAQLAEADHQAVSARDGWTIFNRSLVDALSALRHLGRGGDMERLLSTYRYHGDVFFTPP